MNKCKYTIGVLMLAAMAGCGSIQVYNKGSDDLATSIKSDYEAAKVAEVIAAERINLNALEKKQVDAFVKTVQVERDLQLLHLLSDGGTPFVGRLDEVTKTRLEEIMSAGSIEAIRVQIGLIRNARRQLPAAAEEEAVIRDQLATRDPRFGKLPKCTGANQAVLAGKESKHIQVALNDSTAIFSPTMVDIYGQYTTACADLLQLTMEEKTLIPGLLASASGNLFSATVNLAKIEDEARAAKAAMKDAATAELARTQAMTTAGEIPDATCPKREEKDKPRTGLCEAIEKLEGLGDFGQKILSEEKINDLNTLLRARSGEYPADDADVKAALMLVSTQARFAGARREYKTGGRLPALEPLIIERQLAAARLELATKGVALEKLRVAYRRDMYDALLEEAFLLLQARTEVANITASKNCTGTLTAACASMSRILQDPKLQKETGKYQEPAGRSAYRALALVSESYSVARTRYQSAEMREILLTYQDSLNRSEASLASWHSLIVTPVNQLKTYYADGLKPEEAAQLLQAVGLLGIAARIK